MFRLPRWWHLSTHDAVVYSKLGKPLLPFRRDLCALRWDCALDTLHALYTVLPCSDRKAKVARFSVGSERHKRRQTYEKKRDRKESEANVRTWLFLLWCKLISTRRLASSWSWTPNASDIIIIRRPGSCRKEIRNATVFAGQLATVTWWLPHPSADSRRAKREHPTRERRRDR